MQRELDAYKEAHSVSDAEATERHARLQGVLEEEQAQRQALEAQLEEETGRVAELQAELKEAKEEAEAMRRQAHATEEELHRADAKAQKAERRLHSMESEARRSRQARHADGAAESQLQQLVESQTGLIKDLRKKLEDAQARAAAGGAGVLAGDGSSGASMHGQAAATGGSGPEEEGAGGARRLRRGTAGAATRAAHGAGTTTATATGKDQGKDALLGDFETASGTGSAGGGAESAMGYQASLREMQRKLDKEQEDKQQAVLRLSESARQCSALHDELQRAKEELEDASSRVTTLELNKVRIVAMLEREDTKGVLPPSLKSALGHIQRMDRGKQESGKRAGSCEQEASAGGGAGAR